MTKADDVKRARCIYLPLNRHQSNVRIAVCGTEQLRSWNRPFQRVRLTDVEANVLPQDAQVQMSLSTLLPERCLSARPVFLLFMNTVRIESHCF